MEPLRAVRTERAQELQGVGRIVIVALVTLIALAALLHPGFCLPLASAPAWTLCAITARFVAMGPAWLGWRRAGAFLKPV